ncbi:recombinase family protein [Vibrio astriarenae]|uniref:Recombinase family protein n=2 Tax=Vibrio astriarenae TaxID=1481923 RepID=A0A7Z2T5N3_9VIBR|nr:recombinase family protein [Vibrio astriarenae]
MLIGYARTSTVEQEAGLEAQERELDKLGVDKLFSEQVSSVGEREVLQECIRFCREGDTLVVTKLDRLARSVANLCDIQKQLESKGVELRIADMGLDTATPQGKLMLNVFGAVAQFEREVMLERQREGIAKAKKEGKYKGRKPTSDDVKDQVRELLAQGKKPAEIISLTGIGKTTFYKVKKEFQS